MRTIHILFFLMLLGGLYSCMDGLEVVPENSVTFENYFKTEKDLETSVDAIRDAFRSACAFDAYKRPVELGYLYDTVSKGTSNLLNWDETQFTPQMVDMFWNSQYTVICLANILSENLWRAKLPREREAYYEGQVHFYRAFTYFRIAQKWGEAPMQTDSRDIGKKEKSSVGNILQYALDEINTAVRLLPCREELIDAGGAKIAGKSTASKEIAQALKLDICLWKAVINREPELLKEALSAANFVIDSREYVLAANPEEVCEKVITGGSDEGIFEIKYNYLESTRNPWTTMIYFVSFPIRPEQGRGEIKNADARFFQKTVEKIYPGRFDGAIADGKYTGDRRRLAYFYDLDTIARNEEWRKLAGGYAYPYKFRKVQLGTSGWGEGKFESFACDHVIYRLADIILLRAECLVRMGKNDLAIKDLNRIRQRAYGDKSADYSADEGDLRYAIFKEREKELLWEGKRWYDIVRNGYWKTELSDFHATKMTQQDVDDGALYMPVGWPAFENNSLMTQNKYWLKRY